MSQPKILVTTATVGDLTREALNRYATDRTLDTDVLDAIHEEQKRRDDRADSKRLAALVEQLAAERERFMDPITWGEGVNRGFLLADDLYRIADLLDPQADAR